eukprot:2683331-Prymnesium_polylepis.1
MDSGRERARRVVRQRAWRAAARPGIVCSAAVALVVFDVAELGRRWPSSSLARQCCLATRVRSS